MRLLCSFSGITDTPAIWRAKTRRRETLRLRREYGSSLERPAALLRASDAQESGALTAGHRIHSDGGPP